MEGNPRETSYEKKVDSYFAREKNLTSQRDDLIKKLAFEPEKLGKMKPVYERLLEQTKVDLEEFYDKNKTNPSTPPTTPMQ